MRGTLGYPFLTTAAAEGERHFEPLLRSSLAHRHRALDARFEQRDGWLVAASYPREGERVTAGVVDVSHIGKLEVFSDGEPQEEAICGSLQRRPRPLRPRLQVRRTARTRTAPLHRVDVRSRPHLRVVRLAPRRRGPGRVLRRVSPIETVPGRGPFGRVPPRSSTDRAATGPSSRRSSRSTRWDLAVGRGRAARRRAGRCREVASDGPARRCVSRLAPRRRQPPRLGARSRNARRRAPILQTRSKYTLVDLPVPDPGNASIGSIASGIHHRWTRSARNSRSERGSSETPSCMTTNAYGRSLHRSSRTATTATSAMPSKSRRCPSSTSEWIHSPPDLILSSSRSTIRTKRVPSATATSPVRSQPSAVYGPGSPRSWQWPATAGPRTWSSPLPSMRCSRSGTDRPCEAASSASSSSGSWMPAGGRETRPKKQVSVIPHACTMRAPNRSR